MTDCILTSGKTYGYCEGVFPNITQDGFQQCFDVLYNHPERESGLFDNVWAVFDEMCNNHGYNNSFAELKRFCSGLKAFDERVFNVSVYFQSIIDLQITTYVYPGLLSISCVLHMLMFCVLLFKLERSNGSIIMMCLAANDFVVSILVMVMILIYVAGGFHYDFLPAGLCRFIIIAVEIIPGLFYALSNYFLVALLLDRYLILVYPLEYKMKYDKVKYVIIYCLCVAVLMFAAVSPCLIGMLNLPDLEVASKVDHTKTVVTLLNSKVRYPCDINTISMTILIQKILPVSICIGLEIKCLIMLFKYQRNLEDITCHNRNQIQNVYTDLQQTTLCIAAASLLHDIPYVVALFYIFISNSTETTLYYITNIFSLCSYITISALFLLSSAKIRKQVESLLCPCKGLVNIYGGEGPSGEREGANT